MNIQTTEKHVNALTRYVPPDNAACLANPRHFVGSFYYYWGPFYAVIALVVLLGTYLLIGFLVYDYATIEYRAESARIEAQERQTIREYRLKELKVEKNAEIQIARAYSAAQASKNEHADYAAIGFICGVVFVVLGFIFVITR